MIEYYENHPEEFHENQDINSLLMRILYSHGLGRSKVH